jgi:hypothetical protein
MVISEDYVTSLAALLSTPMHVPHAADTATGMDKGKDKDKDRLKVLGPACRGLVGGRGRESVRAGPAAAVGSRKRLRDHR